MVSGIEFIRQNKTKKTNKQKIKKQFSAKRGLLKSRLLVVPLTVEYKGFYI